MTSLVHLAGKSLKLEHLVAGVAEAEEENGTKYYRLVAESMITAKEIWFIATQLLRYQANDLADVIAGESEILLIFRSKKSKLAAAKIELADEENHHPKRHFRLPLALHPRPSHIAQDDWLVIESKIHTETFEIRTPGFLPGFVYCNSKLGVKLNRLSTPDMQVAPGSVGLISDRLGIYSLPSPAGWNIIGQTIVDVTPETWHRGELSVGDEISFFEVSSEELERFAKSTQDLSRWRT